MLAIIGRSYPKNDKAFAKLLSIKDFIIIKTVRLKSIAAIESVFLRSL